MSLEYLKTEWEVVKMEIKQAKNEDEKHKYLRYAKSIAETAMELYSCDLYFELGGLE